MERFNAVQKAKVIENIADFRLSSMNFMDFYATGEMIALAGQVVEIKTLDHDENVVVIKGLEGSAWDPNWLEPINTFTGNVEEE